MKNTKHIIILIAAIIISCVANATVRTLNNNNPTPGQYNAWIFVQAASSPGDTVYVSGSLLSYGDITVTVFNLTIIGTGHNPQKQNPLISQFDDIHSIVGQLTLIGIKCHEVHDDSVLGLTIFKAENCYFSGTIFLGIFSGLSNTTCYLKNNVFRRTSPFHYSLRIYATKSAATNDLYYLQGEIDNNIFYGSISVQNIGGSVGERGVIYGCNITNNIFVSPYFSGNDNLFYSEVIYDNSIFSNNVILNYGGSNIYYNSPNPSTSSNFSCLNNDSYPNSIQLSYFPNSTGNIVVDPLFVNFPCLNSPCGFDYSKDFHLQPTSTLVGAGTGGTDIGVYGGPYGSSFTMTGEPRIPQMKQVNMPETVVSGSTFSVNIISTNK